MAYKLADYERVRQDGGRTVRHPLGIEPRINARTPKEDVQRLHASSIGIYSDVKSQESDEESVAIHSSRVPWSTIPPVRVVYHDYAWWHEQEVRRQSYTHT